MGNLFKHGIYSRIFLCTTLTSFSIANIPAPCIAQVNTNANDIQFTYRLHQIVEKLHKAIDKNDDQKSINLMLDAKREIEVYTGKQIDIDKHLSQIEKEIKNNGAKVPKKEFEALRKQIKNKEKRLSHKTKFIEICLNENIPFNSYEEELLYQASKEDKDNGTDIFIPIRLTVGVTVALVGLFISIVPVIPAPIRGYGPQLIGYGTSIAAEACYSAYDDSQKKK